MENREEANNRNNLLEGDFGVKNQSEEQTPAVGDSISLGKKIIIKNSNGKITVKEAMFNKHINNKQQELGKILPFKKELSKV